MNLKKRGKKAPAERTLALAAVETQTLLQLRQSGQLPDAGSRENLSRLSDSKISRCEQLCGQAMLNCMPPSDANLLLLLAKGMRNRLFTFPLLDQQVYFFFSSAHMNGIGLNEFYIMLYKIRLTQYYRCSFYFKFFIYRWKKMCRFAFLLCRWFKLIEAKWKHITSKRHAGHWLLCW